MKILTDKLSKLWKFIHTQSIYFYREVTWQDLSWFLSSPVSLSSSSWVSSIVILEDRFHRECLVSFSCSFNLSVKKKNFPPALIARWNKRYFMNLSDCFSLPVMDFSLEKSFETPQSSNQSSYQHVIIRSLSIYALILVIVGTLGNLLAIIILCRRNLRRHVTMRYLIAVSIFDTVSLYGWNLNNFYKFTISSNYHNIEEISLVHCRFLSYMSFVGLQLSSWCLAAVSIGKYFNLRRPYNSVHQNRQSTNHFFSLDFSSV